MKKLLCLCVIFVMAFSMTACARNRNSQSSLPETTSQPADVTSNDSSDLLDDSTSTKDNVDSSDMSSVGA